VLASRKKIAVFLVALPCVNNAKNCDGGLMEMQEIMMVMVVRRDFERLSYLYITRAD